MTMIASCLVVSLCSSHTYYPHHINKISNVSNVNDNSNIILTMNHNKIFLLEPFTSTLSIMLSM